MIIGVDIGASWIRLISLDRNKVQATALPTPDNLSALKKNLTLALKDFEEHGRIQGVGFGVAGNIWPEKIRSSPNIPYLKSYRLKNFIQNNFKCEVILDNDANCFLRAELAWGDAAGRQNALGVTIGSGLGGAIALNGQIIKGAHYGAGEIGHMLYKNKELEDYASAKYFKKRPGNYSALGENLGHGLVSAIRLINPEIIVLGGGIVQEQKKARLVLAAAKKQIAFHLKGEPCAKTSLKISRLGDFAGAMGAITLFKK